MFAKLYETEQHGQILVKLDTGDNGPEVRHFFVPKGYGVCSCGAEFKDTDSGWSSAEKMFNAVTKDAAIKVVSAAKNDLDL